MKTISYTDAVSYIDRYTKTATKTNETIRAMVINDDEYEAMKAIEAAVQGLIGYRIYWGLDPRNQAVFIVVGIKADGSNYQNICYSTTPGGSGFCPPTCDSGNPVT